MKPLEISPITRRRFLMGLHGLYPGRRWQGKADIVTAIRAIGGLQIDPLNVVARSHDLTLWGRVQDYHMPDLDKLLYTERQLFDWGGTIMIYPMADLPHWRVVMERRKKSPRYLKFLAEIGQGVLDEVLARITAEGALTSASFSGTKKRLTTGYRTDKDTGQALYHLWLTGKLMTHSRKGFQRVYDLLERVAPAEFQHTSSIEDAEAYISGIVWAQYGMVTVKGWRTVFQNTAERRISVDEGIQRLETLQKAGEITSIQVTGIKDPYFIRSEDFPFLEALHQGNIPSAWQPLETSTSDEVIFLAPLDMICGRGRAKALFDFEYIWEVYKPAEKRRWGYYTLPVLYQDNLVARLDPKLDSATKTLHLKGLWLQKGINMDNVDFGQALGRGLWNLARFGGAEQLDVSAVHPDSLRDWAKNLIEATRE